MMVLVFNLLVGLRSANPTYALTLRLNLDVLTDVGWIDEENQTMTLP
ncbi:hypothetical protein [Pleionea litopenaei]|uniref:Uncharacterized protein n=1 Tax=Pleionea litopenaei TaxID=3070815 RepID=A0AA51RSH1_9GAMM|nr:hypothetical protein [Pleionea sp. HL-JVS1]WMS86832.1 hypothetical protein Q9312_16550 [Pleionea sp. HL-JVS1]